jgi:hypothetical protein
MVRVNGALEIPAVFAEITGVLDGLRERKAKK